jgi:uncharacterized protein YecE (DUF72 family)
MSEVEDLLLELERLDRRDRGPFPYEGCRRAKAQDREGVFENLIPDLDLYFSDIAGYRSSGKRILRWSEEKLDEARQRLARTFFDRHPIYVSLQSLRREDAPDLFERMHETERARVVLLRLIEALQSTKTHR